MKNIIISVCLLLLAASCVKELPLISGEYVEPKPVFFMFINPDSTLHSFYSRATSITEPNVTIDNAKVTVFKNNVLQGNMLAQGLGKYLLNSNAFLPRDSFKIYGSDDQYNFVVRGKIPANVVIKTLDTQTILIAGLGPAFAFDITFTDSAIDDNYYRLSVRKTWYSYKVSKDLKRIDSTLKTDFINISGSELAFIQNNFNNYTSRELLFSDATFNGTTSKFRIYTPDQVRESLFNRTISLELILENMEKPLYEYYNTRNAHLWQQQSISQLPGVLVGNIAAGYGVAAAYTSTSKTVFIQ